MECCQFFTIFCTLGLLLPFKMFIACSKNFLTLYKPYASASGITSHQLWLNYTGFQSNSEFRFKVALQTYKTVTTKKPEYLVDLLHFQTPSRSLRSSSRTVFMLTLPELVSPVALFGAVCFGNALPAHLTDFSTIVGFL